MIYQHCMLVGAKPPRMSAEVEPSPSTTSTINTTAAAAAAAVATMDMKPSQAWTQLEEVKLEEEGTSQCVDRPLLPGFSCKQKISFFITYLLYICVNSVNGPLMPAMKVSLHFTSHEGATIAAVQTVGISAGKLLYGGWPVDGFGARRTYVGSMLVVGALAAAYSLQHSSAGVAAIAFLVEFLSTPVYPCHVQFIRGWLPVTEAARGFWLLGLSSRTGDVLSKLGFGSLLALLRWEQLTWGAAGLALFAAVLGGSTHADSPAVRDAPGVRLSAFELRSVLRHILCSRQFWLGAAAVSCTTCIKRPLETLSPLFFFESAALVQCTSPLPTAPPPAPPSSFLPPPLRPPVPPPPLRSLCPLIEEGEAAQLAASWSLGLALSVLIGGALFNRLKSSRGKLIVMGGLMTGTTLGCAVMALIAQTRAQTWSAVRLRATVVFLTALGVGLPYYVPSGMFAVQFGGKHSGVVSAYLDSVSFAVSGIFMEAVIGRALDDQKGWYVVWAVLSGVAVAMTVLQLIFLYGLLYPVSR